MAFQVSLHRVARKSLASMPSRERDEICALINKIAEDPWPDGKWKEHLHGPFRKFVKVRHGDDRIVYSIDGEAVRILVLLVGDRKEVYKILKGIVG